MTPLAVPESGLAKVLGAWSGLGHLANALAAAEGAGPDRDWTPADVRRRALRIVLLELAPSLERWPDRRRVWDESLPAVVTRERLVSPAPMAGVSWPRTRRLGWPPESFVVRRRRRHADDRGVAVLAWTAARLSEAAEATASLVGHGTTLAELLGESAAVRVDVALEVAAGLQPGHLTAPSRDDLASLRGEGWPWTAVAHTASTLLQIDRDDGASLAARWLLPDPAFRDRLFHLGVLGALLLAAEEAGASLQSRGPLSGGYGKPAYRIVDVRGRRWDVWFEAGRSWAAYGATIAYPALTSSLRQVDGQASRTGSLRPDILLARHPDVALSVECKYPAVAADPRYVASGLPQAAFYGQELRSAFRRVESYVVGPSELVSGSATRRLRGVRLGILDADGLQHRVRELLG